MKTLTEDANIAFEAAHGFVLEGRAVIVIVIDADGAYQIRAGTGININVAVGVLERCAHGIMNAHQRATGEYGGSNGGGSLYRKENNMALEETCDALEEALKSNQLRFVRHYKPNALVVVLYIKTLVELGEMYVKEMERGPWGAGPAWDEDPDYEAPSEDSIQRAQGQSEGAMPLRESAQSPLVVLAQRVHKVAETIEQLATEVGLRAEEPSPFAAPHIIWRGSVTDLNTDIRSLLGPEQCAQLANLLAPHMEALIAEMARQDARAEAQEEKYGWNMTSRQALYEAAHAMRAYFEAKQKGR